MTGTVSGADKRVCATRAQPSRRFPLLRFSPGTALVCLLLVSSCGIISTAMLNPTAQQLAFQQQQQMQGGPFTLGADLAARQAMYRASLGDRALADARIQQEYQQQRQLQLAQYAANGGPTSPQLLNLAPRSTGYLPPMAPRFKRDVLRPRVPRFGRSLPSESH